MRAGESTARDIGFRFGALPAGVGEPATSREVRYGAATTAFHWQDGHWLVSFDGRPATTTEGEQLAAGTVVIQYVEIGPSRFRDSLGNVTPYTHSVGSGTAVVLRTVSPSRRAGHVPTTHEGRRSRPPPARR